MGTRSTIKFYENGKFLCAIYQQFDGYLSGVGKDLKDFITSKEWVNGFQDKYTQFNGFGCFVAQFIEKFKDGAGGLYITSEGDSQAYNYKVDFQEDKIVVTCDYEFEEDEDEEPEEGYPFDEVFVIEKLNKKFGEKK